MSEEVEKIVDSPPSPSPAPGPQARAWNFKNHPLLAAVYANRMHLVDLARAHGFDRLTIQSLDLSGLSGEPEPPPKLEKPSPKKPEAVRKETPPINQGTDRALLTAWKEAFRRARGPSTTR
jgi:hypothetical protein